MHAGCVCSPAAGYNPHRSDPDQPHLLQVGLELQVLPELLQGDEFYPSAPILVSSKAVSLPWGRLVLVASL